MGTPAPDAPMIDGNALTTRLREEAARRLQEQQESIAGYAQTAKDFGINSSFIDTIIEKIRGFFSWIGSLLGITPAAATEPPAAPAAPARPAAPPAAAAPATEVAPPPPTPNSPPPANRSQGRH